MLTDNDLPDMHNYGRLVNWAKHKKAAQKRRPDNHSY